METNLKSPALWEQLLVQPQGGVGSISDIVTRSLALYEWCEFDLLKDFNAPVKFASNIRRKQRRMNKLKALHHPRSAEYDVKTLQDAMRVLEFSADWLGVGPVSLRQGGIEVAHDTLEQTVALGYHYCSFVGRVLLELHAEVEHFGSVPRMVAFDKCPYVLDVWARISALLERLGFTAGFATSLGQVVTDPLLLITPIHPAKFREATRVAWLP